MSQRQPNSTLFPYTTLFRSIQIDGNTVEIDLDSDGKNEVVATTGTIPETRIYMLKEGKIFVSDINKDRKSTRLNSSHVRISYAVFCLKKKNNQIAAASSTRS